MPKSQKFANPFYGLLIVVGVMFVVTASAYGVMFLQELRGTLELENHPLMNWLENYGNTALLAQLGLLAVATFGAIGTDEYWQRRRRREQEKSELERHMFP